MVQPPPPKCVRWLTDALSKKLGRPAYCRKVKNQNSWYVFDPVWSHVQYGQRNSFTGYRVGFSVDLDGNLLEFTLVHSPITARRFKEACSIEHIISALDKLGPYRRVNYLVYSSRSERDDKRKMRRFDENSASEIVSTIREFDSNHDLIKDLFPVLSSTGIRGGKAKRAGNTFYLGLVNPLSRMRSIKIADKIVDASWGLLSSLYPDEPIQRRDAALRRSMVSKKMPLKCELEAISFKTKLPFPKACSGRIEAAHIKPHAFGGSDKAENGVWLCAFHHRLTEGKLSGKRMTEYISVKYTESRT